MTPPAHPATAPLSLRPRFERRPRTASSLDVLDAHPHAVLGLIVVVSFAARLVAALAHSTPRYFPDEYIYSALARSIGQGSLSIRGNPSNFPALLEPLLSAPFWLSDNVEVAYRLTQGMHALVVSVAAIPAFVIARRLGLPAWQSLACAAFAVSVPGLLFASYLTADATGYTLALAAVAAALGVLDSPTRRGQVAFLMLAGLASFSRVQYVVLPVALVATAILLDGLPVALRKFRLTLIALATVALVVLAGGGSRVLGYYHGVIDLQVDLVEMARWACIDLMLVAFASAWVLAPAAVIGIAGGVRRSIDRRERAFAIFTCAFGGALLVEAALYATNGSARFQERYLLALLPLVPVAACVGWRRLPRGRRPMIAVACALLIVSMRVPLAGYTVGTGKQDSPFLLAVAHVEAALGHGGGSVLVAVIAASLSLAALAGILRRSAAPLIGLSVAIVVSLAASYAAVREDVSNGNAVLRQYAPANPSWVDAHGLRDVAVVITPGSNPALTSLHLFWNKSLTTVMRLDGGVPPDAFGTENLVVARDGLLLERGHPLRRPFFITEHGATATVDGARLVERTASGSLWIPGARPRLTLLTVGRYLDGWLAARSHVTAWPRAAKSARSAIELRLSVPGGAPRPARLLVKGPGLVRTIVIAPALPVTVRLPVTGRRARFSLTGLEAFQLGDARLVSVRLERPRFVSPRTNAESSTGAGLPITKP